MIFKLFDQLPGAFYLLLRHHSRRLVSEKLHDEKKSARLSAIKKPLPTKRLFAAGDSTFPSSQTDKPNCFI